MTASQAEWQRTLVECWVRESGTTNLKSFQKVGYMMYEKSIAARTAELACMLDAYPTPQPDMANSESGIVRSHGA
jgi:hypothetical protein